MTGWLADGTTASPTATSDTRSATPCVDETWARTSPCLSAQLADGSLLEIGVLDLEGDDPVAIHAMTLCPKFYRFLG